MAQCRKLELAEADWTPCVVEDEGPVPACVREAEEAEAAEVEMAEAAEET